MEMIDALDANIQRFQKDLQKNDWSEQRQEALKRLKDNGMPTRKTESWKYTRVPDLSDKKIASAANESKLNLEQFKVDGFEHLFFVNGKVSDASDQTNFIVKEKTELSEDIIDKNHHALTDDFAYNLNLATTKNIFSLELKDNQVAKKPLMIFHLNTGNDDEIKSYTQCFKIGKNAQAHVLEVYYSENSEKSLINYSHHLKLDTNSKLTHIHHQIYDKEKIFFNNIKTEVAKGANYQSFTTTVGAKLTRTNISIDLNEPAAQCMAHGVYTLQNDQHSDVNSFIDHKAPHTDSSQLYKGIMNDSSRGVFTGLIKVERDAQLINSDQLNKNLLLSQKAHANSRPQLEIFADDVKCAHGSTTGQMNEDELFYFESRGIRPEKAQMMLSHAFTYDVLLKIEDKHIRKYIQKDIADKFEKKVFEENND